MRRSAPLLAGRDGVVTSSPSASSRAIGTISKHPARRDCLSSGTKAAAGASDLRKKEKEEEPSISPIISPRERVGQRRCDCSSPCVRVRWPRPKEPSTHVPCVPPSERRRTIHHLDRSAIAARPVLGGAQSTTRRIGGTGTGRRACVGRKMGTVRISLTTMPNAAHRARCTGSGAGTAPQSSRAALLEQRKPTR
jgi:hypothetical protein